MNHFLQGEPWRRAQPPAASAEPSRKNKSAASLVKLPPNTTAFQQLTSSPSSKFASSFHLFFFATERILDHRSFRSQLSLFSLIATFCSDCDYVATMAYGGSYGAGGYSNGYSNG